MALSQLKILASVCTVPKDQVDAIMAPVSADILCRRLLGAAVHRSSSWWLLRVDPVQRGGCGCT